MHLSRMDKVLQNRHGFENSDLGRNAASRHSPADQSLIELSRMAFPMTLTEDIAIAAAAIAGDSNMPNAG